MKFLFKGIKYILSTGSIFCSTELSNIFILQLGNTMDNYLNTKFFGKTQYSRSERKISYFGQNHSFSFPTEPTSRSISNRKFFFIPVIDRGHETMIFSYHPKGRNEFSIHLFLSSSSWLLL